MTSPNLLSQIKGEIPLSPIDYTITPQTGLVIVDIVNGFAKVGAGALAPVAHDDQIAKMVEVSNNLAKQFSDAGLPILLFQDTHYDERPEPPYPPHCIAGSGEEELVDELKWLESDPHATFIHKDCINGFVGSIDVKTNENHFLNWQKANNVTNLLVVGICTDICVMDFVLTTLSARNHQLTSDLKDIIVYDEGCATYNLPLSVTKEIGLPDTAAHPQDLTHYLGLYFMHSRGAIIAKSCSF